ncbi:mucin-5AC isoform X2 [Anastrepha obliqua]|uniref:mucin-5AC isoform X2 n=1 Tax=Anastrepha obliqua TaxID=95512 RepID=UPI00240A9978|nr:mucin-5AC isoform X2 [Anastrepha obliqua]
MASIVGEQQISSNNQEAEPVQKIESREGSVERKVCKDRDEKLKLARERQNEERQRKIEELKAQAEAAQRYREQKEEERRRRIEEIRQRDTEKRHQVEERKRAITEAEKERREYILRKNQERESRLETKKGPRSTVAFAFGSSTPRLLEPDFGLVSPSTYLGHRRSTSITNVTGASLSRRSSERELTDSGAKKRATSAGGTDRHEDHRRKSSSMYEVFNWGYSNDEPPKRFSLSIVGSEINIDDPPTAATAGNSRTSAHHHPQHQHQYSNNANVHRQNVAIETAKTATAAATTTAAGNTSQAAAAASTFNYSNDSVDSHATQIVFRSVARRKTDLMPTIPSPRDGHYGSRSSLSHTPRTPGRAFSMSRLDQLAQPIRRNGEHIRAILERERREQMELLDETESLGGGRRRGSKPRHGSGSSSAGAGGGSSAMSRSMTHLAGGRTKYSLSSAGGSVGGGGMSSSFRPLNGGQRDTTCKSLTQLNNSWSSTTPRSNLGLQTAATRKYLQSSLASSPSAIGTKRSQQLLNHLTNPYRFDPNSLLIMNSSFSITTGSRSGNVTPGGNISTSRPGSAMSTSTNMSTSGYVARRSVPATRKQRPASIAGTGMSLEDLNKHKKDNRPPVKASTPSSTTTSAQNTPKRTSNMMSTSMIVSSSSRLSSAEKKQPSAKREPVTPKNTTPKSLSKTSSSDRLNRASKDGMSKSLISPSPSQTITKSEKDKVTATVQKKEETIVVPVQSKEEKNSLNIAKSEAEFTADSLVESNEPPVVAAPAVADSEGSVTPPPTVENVGAITETVLPVVVVNESNIQSPPEAPEPIEPRQTEKQPAPAPPQPQPHPRSQNGSKENSEVRELTPPSQNGDSNDLMTASMIARSKITTEEEAKAALAERRRLAREEAERQAELERQRLEAERLAELKRQEEEAERQRAFEEEANRLAMEQRRAEEERLRQAIEEAKQKEEEDRRKREEEEKQRVQREEAERKAKEEAEKQRFEVAERLKREEKEREERRKRVEAIMSRTRKGTSGGGGSATTPNSTPVKENNTPKSTADNLQPQQLDQSFTTTTVTNAVSSTDSSSTSGSTTTATTPNPPPQSITAPVTAVPTNAPRAEKLEPQNTQAMYEQAVIDKETELINSFSNMIIDENVKNLQQQHLKQPTQIIEVSNGKLPINSDALLQNTTITTTTINVNAVANGNGHHIENLNNENDINNLQDAVTPATNQLIDLSIESQDINNAINFNNNNSLLNTTTTATLVTADSHENKDISLL